MAYQPHEPAAEQAYQTTAPLGIGGVYDSGIIDLRGWTQVDTRITSDQDGTITIRWYSDAAGTDQVRLLTIPYSAANGFQLFSAPAFTPFNRYEYTNGGVAQTDFFFETKLLHVPLSPQILGTTAFIAEGMVTQLNRSILTGQQPDGDFVNAKSDGSGIFNPGITLGGGAVYESPWVDTDGFNAVQVFISTDVASATNGIEFEYTDDVQAVAPPIRATDTYSYTQTDIDRGYVEITFPPRLDGFRVRYTNGPVAQTAFFLQAELRTNFSPARLTQAGTQVTSDFTVEVALGNIPNYANGTKFGLVKSMDSADVQPVTVWRLADDGRAPLRVGRKTFSTVAANAFVASNNIADAGKQITVILNDATNTLASVDVVLDGLDGRTPVDTGVSSLDCNVAFISGPDEELVGDVYVTRANNFTNGVPNDGTEVLAFVPQESGRTQQGTYRVPADTTLVIRNVHSTVTAGTNNGSATVNLRVRPVGGSWYTVRPYNLTTAVGVERDEVITLQGGSLVEFNIEDLRGNDLNVLSIFNYDLISGS